MQAKRRPDFFIIGVLAGIFSSLIRYLLGFSIIYFLPSYLNCVRIAACILLPPAQVMAGGFWVTAIGLQIDMVVSVAVSLVTLFILEYSGFSHYLFKGAIIGATTWSVFYVVLSRSLSQFPPVASILAIELSFLVHIIYGMVLTWTIIRLKKAYS
ncbi:MAG: hypothetical protein GX197_05070 [Firmicutes bacterium]|nr:hypothetical protein [Bacillota bacterium]